MRGEGAVGGAGTWSSKTASVTQHSPNGLSLFYLGVAPFGLFCEGHNQLRNSFIHVGAE